MAGESHVQVVTKAVVKQKQHTLLQVQETGGVQVRAGTGPVFSSSVAKTICDSCILLLEGSRYPKLGLWPP